MLTVEISAPSIFSNEIELLRALGMRDYLYVTLAICSSRWVCHIQKPHKHQSAQSLKFLRHSIPRKRRNNVYQ